MPKLAISYRRSDSSAIAGRIFDRLTAHYGKQSVFMDIDHIPIGTDFRTHIQETLQRTDVLIAVIGPKWVGIDAAGDARIQDEKDPVRGEIETALARDTPIIPVLVDGARMPDSSALPADFGNFAFLNAAEVAIGRDFHVHMDRLIEAIDRITAPAADFEPSYSTSEKLQSGVANAGGSARWTWLTDVLRYLVVPLVLLLVAHHLIVNALDLNTGYLRIVSALVPFGFGFALFWASGRGAGPASAFALTLGILAVAGMTLSEWTLSENSDSIRSLLPQDRVEWRDNIEIAAGIALSFMAGHVLARAVHARLSRKVTQQ